MERRVRKLLSEVNYIVLLDKLYSRKGTLRKSDFRRFVLDADIDILAQMLRRIAEVNSPKSYRIYINLNPEWRDVVERYVNPDFLEWYKGQIDAQKH